MTYCWACGQWGDPRFTCADCTAPPWKDSRGPEGVYLIEAHCGLNKIGWSGRSVYRRITSLEKEGRQRFAIRTLLPGADQAVERWLHATFADIRDVPTARAERLPAATEWFWPSPALDRLADDEEFIREGVPWEEAAYWDPTNLEASV